ncbi:hypothetical protein CANMA_000097 [Candida margitis]|uniref:uncharacterized protein n=1 Tax=Candida margitis TaxID=1775924 RepID=UPI002226F3A8|nr:uncharacterized protein CANMA_000097 [Candida margitis]KAI5970937.1 hypothetical protein CANMA_000097 [Candida margitis]
MLCWRRNRQFPAKLVAHNLKRTKITNYLVGFTHSHSHSSMITSLEASVNFISKAIDLYDFKNALKPLTVGVSGPQGSGKTYLASCLTKTLEHNNPNLRFTQFSIDDFYLTRSEQEKVTQVAVKDENKLLQGRGLPGTHDLKLLKDVLHQICGNYKSQWVPVKIPSYDKSAFGGLGDRLETDENVLQEPVDVIICEGWFNGFMPLDEDLVTLRYLTSPVDSILQRHKLYQIRDINNQLSSYVPIWEIFSHFIILQTDTIENVYKWRLEQEHALIALKSQGMSDDEVISFVDRYMPMYLLCYEQLCEQGLENAQSLTLSIDFHRQLLKVKTLDDT